MRNLKKNEGITLIALVITIIVLLILAGVSLNLVLGNDGILGKATKAALENRGSEVQEIVEMWKVEHRMNQYLEDKVMTEEELIADLKGKKLVYEEELNTEEKTIIIGTKEIYYGLEAKLEYTPGNVFEYTQEGYITGIKAEYIEGREGQVLPGGDYAECDILVSKLGGVLNIPNEIDGVKIVGIEENALAQIGNLISVRIPKSVTEIKNEAFKRMFWIKDFNYRRKCNQYRGKCIFLLLAFRSNNNREKCN